MQEGIEVVYVLSGPPSKPGLTEIETKGYAMYMDSLVVSNSDDDG